MEVGKNNGYELYYASEELRDDREYVRKAETNSNFASKIASNELKNDVDLIITLGESWHVSTIS